MNKRNLATDRQPSWLGPYGAAEFDVVPESNIVSREEIILALQQRLDEVRRNSKVKVPEDDLFELGIDCRLANELFWLEQLLSSIKAPVND